MPVVTIDMWEGRTIDQKRELVKAITEDIARIAKTEPKAVQIIIRDHSKSNWGTGGELASEKS